MITDVAIDLDGVMFDFANVIKEHFSECLDRDLPDPVKWEFYDEWGLTAEQFYYLLDEFSKERDLFNSEAPVPHSMVGWQSLRDQNLRLHVITHRSPSAWEQSIRWLERYRMVPDSLHFSGDKANILTAISIDECAAIDDHVSQYVSYRDAGVHAYLMTQTWNALYPGRRVSSLPEFADIIKLYNQYQYMEEFYAMQELRNV